jgi:hypothetical protein
MSSYLYSRISEYQRRFLIVGAVALGVSVPGAIFSARQFFVSYLFAYLFWFGIAFGCILIAMIHHLTGGRWGHPIRRFLEAGFGTFPLLALLFVPILFGLRELYPWARDNLAGGAAPKTEAYLQPWFFIVRAVLYFSVWLLLAWRLRKWSVTQDDVADPEPSKRLVTLSGPGLVIFPITATFAYIDWIMSLEPKWYSTIFAVIVLAGQVLAAYGFAVVLLKIFENQPLLASITSKVHFHQLGNLLLTFVMFWTYVAFGQLLVIYSGNTPEEIVWYLHRIEGSWKYIVGLIAVFHFFLPFLLLLFRSAKRRSSFLAGLATMLLLAHLIDIYWMITPSIFHGGIHVNWLDFAAPVGIGGLWIAAFLWVLKQAPLLAPNDPRMREEMADATR